MRCNMCGNENLIESEKESKLITNAKYIYCIGCNNVMLLTEDGIVPTPTEDNDFTRKMIQDAKECFEMQVIVSLDGENIKVKDVFEQMQNFIKSLESRKCNCEDCECDYEDDYEDSNEIIERYEGDKDYSISLLSNKEQSDFDDYMIVLPSGEKQIYRNTLKSFMINIINDIGSEVRLYKISEIELKQEVKYTF